MNSIKRGGCNKREGSLKRKGSQSKSGTGAIRCGTYGLLSMLFCGVLSVESATCSCAGVPLTGTINLADFEANQYQFNLTYDYHDLGLLVAGKDTVSDETGRDRTTESLILQTSYGFNERWAITGVVSWVQHRRRIAISNTPAEDSSGVGDSLVVVSYAPQKLDPFSRDEWAFGLGVRLPTGIDDNGSPIVFAEDLQPGQGAWGYSGWLHYARSFSQQADWVLFVDANYAVNGKNDREYSFESESNLSSGVSYAGDSPWSFSAAINYRRADSHSRFGNPIPNTGGEWLDLIPAVQLALNPSTSLGLSARLPVSRDLNGSLQFTTRRSVSLSVRYLF